nr:MAG: hypothetical protein [Molluscum contagiosum virus]
MLSTSTLGTFCMVPWRMLKLSIMWRPSSSCMTM